MIITPKYYLFVSNVSQSSNLRCFMLRVITMKWYYLIFHCANAINSNINATALIKYIIHAYTSSQNNILAIAIIIYVCIARISICITFIPPPPPVLIKYIWVVTDRQNLETASTSCNCTSCSAQEIFPQIWDCDPQTSRIHSCKRRRRVSWRIRGDDISWRT